MFFIYAKVVENSRPGTIKHMHFKCFYFFISDFDQTLHLARGMRTVQTWEGKTSIKIGRFNLLALS